MDNIAYRGSKKTVLWANDGRSLRGKKHFEEMSIQDRAKVYALFKRMGDYGEIKNDEKFRKEEGPIWCFKSFQQRFPCFFDGSEVVITHGYKKKKDKMPKSELERAKRIRGVYFERRKGLPQ